MGVKFSELPILDPTELTDSDYYAVLDTSSGVLKRTTPQIPLPFEMGGTGNVDGYVRAGRSSHTLVGLNSTAEGKNTESSGTASHAEGYNSKALNDYSHAEGSDTVASGRSSHSSGEHTVAGYTAQSVVGTYNNNKSDTLFEVGNGSGDDARSNALEVYSTGSVVEGRNSCQGNFNHVGGYDSIITSSATGSFAHGGSVQVTGSNSAAFGSYTAANHNNQLVCGVANNNKSDTLFEVGNGSARGQHINVFEVYSDGKLSQDNGSTKFKFTSNGPFMGYVDSNNNFHKFTELDDPVPIEHGGTGNTCGYIQTGRDPQEAEFSTTATIEGLSNVAKGQASHVEGRFNKAIGDNSHAEGSNTTTGSLHDSSVGQDAHAEGHGTTALGYSSHAEGEGCIAKKNYSHAEGYFTNAEGESSHTEGNSTTTQGDNSHAEGYGSTTYDSASASHAEGYYTGAYGKYSHAEGYYSDAEGDASHSEGDHTLAQGYASHAEGMTTRAIGDYSHTGGQFVQNDGLASFVHGLGSSELSSGLFKVNQDYVAVFGDNNHKKFIDATYTEMIASGAVSSTSFGCTNCYNNSSYEAKYGFCGTFYTSNTSDQFFLNNLEPGAIYMLYITVYNGGPTNPSFSKADMGKVVAQQLHMISIGINGKVGAVSRIDNDSSSYVTVDFGGYSTRLTIRLSTGLANDYSGILANLVRIC